MKPAAWILVVAIGFFGIAVSDEMRESPGTTPITLGGEPGGPRADALERAGDEASPASAETASVEEVERAILRRDEHGTRRASRPAGAVQPVAARNPHHSDPVEATEPKPTAIAPHEPQEPQERSGPTASERETRQTERPKPNQGETAAPTGDEKPAGTGDREQSGADNTQRPKAEDTEPPEVEEAQHPGARPADDTASEKDDDVADPDESEGVTHERPAAPHRGRVEARAGERGPDVGVGQRARVEARAGERGPDVGVGQRARVKARSGDQGRGAGHEHRRGPEGKANDRHGRR